MPAAAAVRAHRDRFDVARAQRASAVEQPPLDERGVADQLGVLPCQRVHPAERMLPVVVGEVAQERLVEEGSRGTASGGVQLRGVGGADRQ